MDEEHCHRKTPSDRERSGGQRSADLFRTKGGCRGTIGQEPKQKMFVVIFWGSVYVALLVLVSVVGVREWLKKHRSRNTCRSERKDPDGEKETARINNR
jgi:hypothetical protein